MKWLIWLWTDHQKSVIVVVHNLADVYVSKWSNNYAYTIAISNGCMCHSYVILVLVVMS